MKLAQKKMLKPFGEAFISGVKGVFTMHGKDVQDIKNNKAVNNLLETKKIEKVIFL